MKLGCVSKIALASTLTLALFCVSCTTNEKLVALEASVAAFNAFLTTAQTQGQISPEVASEILAATGNLPTVFKQTAVELSSADSDAVRAAKISGYFAPVVLSLTSLSPEAKLWSNALLQSINAFLVYYPSPAAAPRMLRAERGGGKVALQSEARTKFDGKRLTKILDEADEQARAVELLRSKMSHAVKN